MATKKQTNNNGNGSSFVEKFKRGFVRAAKTHGFLVLFLVALGTFITSQNPVFLTSENLFNVLRQVTNNLLMCSGLLVILILGGIDLSGGEVIAMVSIICASALKFGVSVPLTIVMSLAAGILIGAVNGMILSRTSLTPFIVTLSMSYVLKGVAFVLTNAVAIGIANRDFLNLAIGYVGPVPLPVIYVAVILFVVWLVLKRTKLGRHIFAVGGNVVAATFSGINVKNIRLGAYVWASFCAAFSALVLAGRSYSGNAIYGQGAALDAIAAVTLGGTSMAGGRGTVPGTILGALIIGVINNGLNLIGMHSYYQMILKGIIILVSVYADFVRRSREAKNVVAA